MTTLLLVRHGETDAITGRYIAGTAAGTPLNSAGQAQVQQLAERLSRASLTSVVSSPLTRSRETAEPIAQRHGLPIRILPALSELEFGKWTGRTYQDLEDDPEWRRFNAVRSLVRPPGGELMLDVQRRAVTALCDLAPVNGTGTVVVVSHGDVIRAALLFFLGMPLDYLHRLEVAPARVSIVAMDGYTPVVRQVNGDSVPADV